MHVQHVERSEFPRRCSRGLLDQRAHVSSLNRSQNAAAVETGLSTRPSPLRRGGCLTAVPRRPYPVVASRLG